MLYSVCVLPLIIFFVCLSSVHCLGAVFGRSKRQSFGQVIEVNCIILAMMA